MDVKYYFLVENVCPLCGGELGSIKPFCKRVDGDYYFVKGVGLETLEDYVRRIKVTQEKIIDEDLNVYDRNEFFEKVLRGESQ